MNKEQLYEFFQDGYAGFYDADDDYSDVVIDGHYDLNKLESLFAQAISLAIKQERADTIQALFDNGIIYQDDDRVLVGVHGDSDVTDEIQEIRTRY